MAAKGHLSPTSLMFRDDQDDWRELAEFEVELGLRRNAWGGYSAPPTAPPPPEWGGVHTNLASAGDRFWAAVIDWFVQTALNIVAALLLLPLFLSGSGPLPGIVVFYLMSSLIYFGYEILLTAVRGQTVGKTKMNIEVARKSDAALPTFRESFLRALVKAFTLNGCTLPVVLVLWLATPNRRNPRDAPQHL